MNKNKISSIAIVTILTLSIMLAAIPMASAIDVPDLTETHGPVGTKITVSGTTGAASTFGLVGVYWDSLATKIAEGYAEGDGSYEIKYVVIPEDVAGIHDIIVKDEDSTPPSQTAKNSL